jgi:uncharacterized protein YigA (DUF484 family)
MADGKGLPDARPASGLRAITDADVLAHLAAHPDFLSTHSDLIPVLAPPQQSLGGNVVDLQAFMVHRLQDEVLRLKTQHRALISTSRSNLTSQQRIHTAVLAVVGAASFEALIQVVTTDLAVLLDVDVVTLCVESAAGAKPPKNGVQLLPKGFVDGLIGVGREALLEDHVRGDPVIFGAGAGLVQSEALVRLPVAKAPPGLLALGSRKPTKFKSGHGTELLSFLARALGVTIGQWLDL